MRFLLGLSAVCVVFLQAGCGPIFRSEGCDLSAKPSVRVVVKDSTGAPVSGALVIYTVNGGPESEAECVTAEPCTNWVAGREEIGTIRIRATRSDGTGAAEETVEVSDGRCHPIAQDVELVLN